MSGNDLHGLFAESLRREFDLSFGATPPSSGETYSQVLRIRVAGDGYALPIRHLAGLFADRRIVPLPGRGGGLLGIAGFRGSLVPVFSLRALLSYPEGEPGRWLVLARDPEPFGLAFDAFDGHLRVPKGALAPVAGDSSGSTSRFVRGGIRTGEVLLGVIDIPSLASEITGRARQSAPPEER